MSTTEKYLPYKVEEDPELIEAWQDIVSKIFGIDKTKFKIHMPWIDSSRLDYMRFRFSIDVPEGTTADQKEYLFRYLSMVERYKPEYVMNSPELKDNPHRLDGIGQF